MRERRLPHVTPISRNARDTPLLRQIAADS
jgi:hypothetical protein